MPYELFLALRYFYSRRRQRLARVTALFAVAGIAFGVAALIVALALSNGFRDEMRDKILSSTAHVTLMRRDGQPFADYPQLKARVREVEAVKDASATIYDGALISGTNSSAYAILRGLDTDSTRSVEQLRRSLTAGAIEPLLHDSYTPREAEKEDEEGNARASANEPGRAALLNVIVGSELASRLGLRVGDTAQLISGDAALTPLGQPPRARRARVAGIFRSGLYEYDAAWVYLSLSSAQGLSGEPPKASAISLEVADIYDVAGVAARVRERAGQDFITVDWQEANRPLFAALALERRMGLFIIAIIILLAALNITTTLVMVVVERRADIAILSAMGARARSIMLLFIIEGALIGAVGAISGVLLGLAASFIGDRYRLVSLPPDVYSISNVPFHTRAGDVALAALVAFALSLLATIYPARVAARLRPAEALRDR